jgi:hypothetical protein
MATQDHVPTDRERIQYRRNIEDEAMRRWKQWRSTVHLEDDTDEATTHPKREQP